MEPENTWAVAERLAPNNLKELQCFLGFVNFYRWLKRNYKSMAAPLTAPFANKIQFSWTPDAEASVQELKLRFSSAPVLNLPDPAALR